MAEPYNVETYDTAPFIEESGIKSKGHIKFSAKQVKRERLNKKQVKNKLDQLISTGLFCKRGYSYIQES